MSATFTLDPDTQKARERRRHGADPGARIRPNRQRLGLRVSEGLDAIEDLGDRP